MRSRRRRRNSHGRFWAPPGMENVAQPPPAVLFQSRRGRLLHIDKEFFTVKPAVTIKYSIQSLDLGRKSLESDKVFPIPRPTREQHRFYQKVKRGFRSTIPALADNILDRL
jgi:hypothetical protein